MAINKIADGATIVDLAPSDRVDSAATIVTGGTRLLGRESAPGAQRQIVVAEGTLSQTIDEFPFQFTGLFGRFLDEFLARSKVSGRFEGPLLAEIAAKERHNFKVVNDFPQQTRDGFVTVTGAGVLIIGEPPIDEIGKRPLYCIVPPVYRLLNIPELTHGRVSNLRTPNQVALLNDDDGGKTRELGIIDVILLIPREIALEAAPLASLRRGVSAAISTSSGGGGKTS